MKTFFYLSVSALMLLGTGNGAQSVEMLVIIKLLIVGDSFQSGITLEKKTESKSSSCGGGDGGVVEFFSLLNLECLFDCAGGAELDRQCHEYIQQRGSLSSGEVFTSGSGRLPCRVVVHTVGPVWHDGKKGEDRELEKAVRGALDACRKYKTVALPAISCGIFGFPPDLAAEITIREIRDFMTNDSSSVSRVDVVVLKRDVISEFQKVFMATFGAEKVSNLSSMPASSVADSGGTFSYVKIYIFFEFLLLKLAV